MAWDAKNHMIAGAKNIQTNPNIFFIVFILFFGIITTTSPFAQTKNSKEPYLKTFSQAQEFQKSQKYQTKRVTSPELEKILYDAIPILDHGFVRVVDYMGDDSSIVQSARVSYGIGTKKVLSFIAMVSFKVVAMILPNNKPAFLFCLYFNSKIIC